MFRAYDKNGEISYSLGAFPTVELIKRRSEDVLSIALHSKFRITDEVEAILESVKDKVITSDRAVERVAKKGNTFMVGAFRKRYEGFETATHVCLVNPSDAGNLGTIMRTMLGFDVKNLCIVGESADVYDPRAVRASMGAVFALSVSLFETWEDYAKAHTEPKYLFMLDERSKPLGSVKAESPCAYVFGNEGSGLPSELAEAGTPIIITHTKEIDSLNLPQAVAIGLYEMTKDDFKRLP
ncbi:MAG: TrmH family RNA methyltransferase [Clostridia bacterium]|nr:TrmH family RNA methyltransferase [Clostridia bacterium]